MSKKSHHDTLGAEVPAEPSIDKLTELMLRSQRGYRELIDNLDQALFTLSLEGEIRVANLRLSRILGASFQDLIGHKLSEFIESPAPSEMLRAVPALLHKGFWSATVAVRLKSVTEPRYFQCWLQTVPEEGQPAVIAGWARDVTEQHEIEGQLHREQEFVRRLVKCFPDMIAVLDREGRFTYLSQRAREMLGVSPQEYLGRKIGGATHPDDQPELASMVQGIVGGTSELSQVESRVRHKDGSWRTLRTTASPMFDEQGQIAGVVASVRDVTELNLAGQKTAQKEKFAAMGQMMAGAAHELNNPLTAILGVSDLLRERATDDSTRRQIDLILQQARRAAGIIQNLLAFSRFTAQGRPKLRLEELLNEVLRAQSASLAQKKVDVKFAAAPAALPSVEGDRRLLSQVFSNLITNAEQSVAASRDHGTIEIVLRDVEGRVCVTIADNGSGIPPENLSKVFDPFFTTKRPGGGSGLGLTICLAVVKDHGGTIEVSSTAGMGAAFHVFLPAAGDEIKQAQQSTSSPDAVSKPKSSQPLAGRVVLVVDDEESIREIIQEGLSARGMNVHAVESCEQAMSYLESNSCDVVICDFNLPGMRGDKLFERLSTDRRTVHLPHFVFMTGDLVDSAFSDTLRQKGAQLLQKPFHIGALADLMRELLQK
ncbi:MAG TPA: PAS domain S-box protein [Candidatus Dormibacteraeota bacterium]|nr:PAS domain S-box protein [Candidatus Dormibacteraeota bacterium]